MHMPDILLISPHFGHLGTIRPDLRPFFRKPDAMATSVLILRLEPGPERATPKKKFRKNFFSKKKKLFSVVRVYECHGALSSPQVPMSPGRDPLLSSLLVGVRVEHGVNAGHGEHRIPVCGLLCRLVDDIALCLSIIRRAYAFRLSGDQRDFILLSSYRTSSELLGRVATVYVVPSHNEGGAKGATGILPSSLCFSEQVAMLW